MILIIEGAAMCFFLLIVCVIGISYDGPVGLVCFYEKDVQERAVELGLTTRDKVRKRSIAAAAAVTLPMTVAIPYMVYGINGAAGFRQGFIQMAIIATIANIFDRVFIDWYWVGKTNAWTIPGTEDLKPYIPKNTLIKKWVGTLVVHPLVFALIAWAMDIFGK
ncbi:MAG: hypothetical protein IJU78_01590 [Clostridia bacterium]|nr:hypothetical protein [Clostridia bacterium]